MKTKLMMSMVVFAALACNKANFGSGNGKRNGGSVKPGSGDQNPGGDENPPLDVSELEDNKGIDGPKAGKGQDLEKVIELDCDQSEGVIVDVTPGKDGSDGKDAYGDDAGDGTDGTEGKDATDGKDGAEGGDDKGSEAYDDPKNAAGLLLQDKGKGAGKDGGNGYDPTNKGKDIDTDGKPTGGKDGGGKDGEGEKPLPEKPPVEVPEQAKVIAKVKGKFCPTAQKKLTVLFVVDYSGSMGRHVPERGQTAVAGNDPQINGSCGRLRAAEAIIAKINDAKESGDQIEIGMVPFAGGIVTNKIVPVQALADFQGKVTKETFCSYVVQNSSFGYDPQNPGGIDGSIGLFGGVDSSTNYRAAFNAAGSILQSVYGRKVVYFISDGEPTSGGQDPIQAGIDAGTELRNNVENLTLNALLLGNTGPGAEQVLVQVAGAPERVRKAAQADQLAEEILKFADASIDESTGKALLSVEGYPTADLGLKYLNQDPNQPGIWIYETQPFVLLGKPGVDVWNVVDVTAKGKDGSSHAAQVKIRYRQ